MSNPTSVLIIPAAGSGSRMGAVVPKPYLTISGKTVLEHTLSCFTGLKGLKQVVISTSEQYTEFTRKKALKLFPDIDVDVVIGGRERQDSICNALSVVNDDLDLVIVHDAVRPFISGHKIANCVMIASEKGAAIVAVPVKDTIKKADSNMNISETPQRKYLWQAQTPQVFSRKLIMKAYCEAKKSNFKGTDDASLVERLGLPVAIVEGDRQNFKLTYPLDFKIAESLINGNLQEG